MAGSTGGALMFTPVHWFWQRQSCSAPRMGCWLSRSASREVTGQAPYPEGPMLGQLAKPEEGYRSAATVASPRPSVGGTRVTPPSAGGGVARGEGGGGGWALGG